MKVKFVGGPLNGKKLEMDVYIKVIPIDRDGYDQTTGRPNCYYINVMPEMVSSRLESQLPVMYVYHRRGLMFPSVSRTGEYLHA